MEIVCRRGRSATAGERLGWDAVRFYHELINTNERSKRIHSAMSVGESAPTPKQKDLSSSQRRRLECRSAKSATKVSTPKITASDVTIRNSASVKGVNASSAAPVATSRKSTTHAFMQLSAKNVLFAHSVYESVDPAEQPRTASMRY